MSDMSSMSRESRKQKLRQRVISADAPIPPQLRSELNAEESEEAVALAQKKARRRKLILLAALLAVIGGAAGGLYYYQRNYQYVGYETDWQTDLNEGSLVGYESFGNNVLKYTKDGASYIDNHGKTVWTESYEMKNPIVARQGEYVAIADRQGNKICIFGSTGKVGEASTVLPISKVTISGTGIVAAVVEDSTASYVMFYDRDGSSLQVGIKTIISGDGYVLGAALSNDGTQLMCSVVYIRNGELKNRVVFYDFSEVGKNVPDRIVGGFDDPFDGTIVPRVFYMNNSYSCAISGKGLTFFSTENIASPSLVAQVAVESEIQSVCYNKDYVAMVLKNPSGEYTNSLQVYKKDGTHAFTKDFTYEYTHLDIDDDLIILYNENSCEIFNMAGVQKLYATFDFTVSKVRKGRFPNTLVVSGPQQMREIKLR
ncbi:DUF5711 family protein [Brotaphodocola sp.]|uniref:DUF5711 family protein n=1 Tax=Brotaphodocola sp. TaxID=3073577 RepID=UPI003D7E0D02